MKPGYELYYCIHTNGFIIPEIPGQPNVMALPGGKRINKQTLLDRLRLAKQPFTIEQRPLAGAPEPDSE
jgi:hypothetical protein|tara:strand:- start:609 stop:815 length:207 start_codon:yes stop_codon:yes gene_type:complete